MLRQNRLSRINIVTTTKQGRTPGRPRQFDAEQAIETAQRLFHARGYDAVSVADLTQAFGINPPSFYAAFGSKLGLYTRVLQRYSQTGAIPIDACCETTAVRRRSSPYCRRRLAAMWSIRPPPAAWCWRGYMSGC